MMRLAGCLVLALAGCTPSADTGTDDTDTDETDVVDTDETDPDTDGTDDTDAETDETDETDPVDDLDADGWTVAEGDCDDHNELVYPFAVDVPYDGVDANCRGDSDYDADYDGHDGDAWGGDDCDDQNAAVRPSATDRPYDGIDADCSGGSDYDADLDGHVSDDHGGDDCDDFDDAVHPGAVEVYYDGIDGDCAGGSEWDADGDGQEVTSHSGLDCDDTDPDVYSGAPDTPYDGVDSDCSGFSDYDFDEDGFDDVGHGGDDCDDLDGGVFPGAAELCTLADENCDGDPYAGAVDELDWFLDLDEDGWGTERVATSCEQPAFAADSEGDCDDDDPTTHPQAEPVPCDGHENDCDYGTLEPMGEIRVAGGVYADLAAAFVAAPPGGTIELCEGEYVTPPVVVDHGVSFVGLAGAQATRVSPSGPGSVLEVRTAETVVVQGLTLSGGTGTPIRLDERGGAIYLHDGGSLRLVDAVIADNVAENGGGLWVGVGGTAELVGSVVRDNVADAPTVGKGGGIVVDEFALLLLDDSQVRGNLAEEAGGLWLSEGAELSGSNGAKVTGNEALIGAGGITAKMGDAVILGVEVSHNLGTVGAGIDGRNVTIVDTVVTANRAELVGGGISLLGTSVMERVDVIANTSDIQAGGIDIDGLEVPAPGVYDDGDPSNDPAPTLRMVDCRIQGNEADPTLAAAAGIVLTRGALVSLGTDWGPGSTTPPIDLALYDDARSYRRAGVVSEICVDGNGEGCF